MHTIDYDRNPYFRQDEFFSLEYAVLDILEIVQSSFFIYFPEFQF
jgi:hypothetical protein